MHLFYLYIFYIYKIFICQDFSFIALLSYYHEHFCFYRPDSSCRIVFCNHDATEVKHIKREISRIVMGLIHPFTQLYNIGDHLYVHAFLRHM